ncbi:hypothetical protein BCO26_0195 [Heyndrickxia coagulans 2-6]|nr:hypothetical protein BCO26_0195 [Heyndrickxia coagulans 2-6]
MNYKKFCLFLGISEKSPRFSLKDIRKLLFSMAVLSYIRIINLRKGVGKAMLDHFIDA